MKVLKSLSLIFGVFSSFYSGSGFQLHNHVEPIKSLSFFPFTQSNIDKIQEDYGKEIVLQISSLLPKFDTIGHDILRANHDFIQDVLATPYLEHESKKSIILFSIKLAQHGDDMGSYILQQYYNIVDACL